MTALLHANDAKVQQRTMKMLDQQFWRWGCDVKHSAGNLLVQYGFLRIPKSNQSSSKSSVYQLEIGPHARVALSSSTMFYGDNDLGGMLFKRFDCRPYYTPSGLVLDSLWEEENDLIPTAFGDCSWRELASQLIAIIVEYESWVTCHFGRKYISDSLTSRGKRPFMQAGETPAEWKKIAYQISQGP